MAETAMGPLFGFLFGTPLTALLAAAGTAALPIIIHLLNRKRFRVITWAAMRFLLAAQKKNTRKMRLEQLILLAVRTAIVLFLVLAMASVMPWAEELWSRLFPESAARAAMGSLRTHKIVVLDASLSMAARIGEGTLFDQALTTTKRMLGTASAGDGFSVLIMATPVRRLISEPSEDLAKIRGELDGLQVTHGNADLAGTLNALDDLLRRSPAKFEDREVYFITDMQRSTWLPKDGTAATEVVKRLQSRARLILVDVGQEGFGNAAVTNLTLGTPFVAAGTATPLSVALQNFRAGVRRQARVEIHVARARTTGKDPPMSWQLVAQRQIDLPPGLSVVTFHHRFPGPGDYAIQARLEGDTLEPDDQRTAVVSVREHIPVMLVNGKPAAEIYDRATEWLFDALNPYQAGTTPRTVAVRPRVVSETQFSDARLGDLNPYDCVFLCDVPRLGAGEIRRLETHLRRGGGVVFCLGPRVDLELYNRLLYRGGEGILPGRLLAVQQGAEKRSFNLFGDDRAFAQQPLEAFAGDRDRASLLSARFHQYVRMELPAKTRARKVLSFVPEAVPTAPGSLAPPSSMPAGDPAVVESTYHRGRIIVLTSTVNMDWTAWPISPSFPAFMQEMVQFAVSGRLRERTLTVGDPIEEILEAGGRLDAQIQLPGGQLQQLRTEESEEASVLRWGDTDRSGLYRANVGQHPADFLFAVNVPSGTDEQQATESDLARTNLSELLTRYPGSELQVVTNLDQVVRAAASQPIMSIDRPIRGMGMIIARWLLLVMLVLITAEVILAWQFGHYTAVAPTGQQPTAPGRFFPVLAGLVFGTALVALSIVLIHAVWTNDFLGFLPEGIRAQIERQMDIPPPAAGEGSRWRLEFTSYLWDAATDPWLAGVLGVGLVILVVTTYYREGQTAGRAYKLLLAGLRAFLILLALAVLLPQVRLVFEREGWPDVAIVLDDSRSMGTVDRYQDQRIQQTADQLARDHSLVSPGRLQLAQAFLANSDHDWLKRLLTNRRVKLHLYRGSARAARTADATEPRDLEKFVREARAVEAQGDSSQLGTVVRQVLNDFRGSSLAAVIMFTDGVTTEGEDLVRVSRIAAQSGVPLYFIGMGDEHEIKDVILSDLQVEDSVYVNDSLIFEGRIAAQGYTDGRPVAVTLSERGRDGSLKRLDEQRVISDPQGRPVKFRLVHRPKEAGEKSYVVAAQEQPDEVKPAENNRQERRVFVRETKLIKVLYVEGYARYDFRFLKHLLERESDRDRSNKTVDLRVLLVDSDAEYASEDKSALADFPTREELNGYDVLLLGDVDPRDPKIGDKNLRNLVDFVRERGGGFMMIAGPRHSPHAYKNTPLAEILPIQIQADEQPDIDAQLSYRPELTTIGRFHPMFRFSPSEAENSAVWNRLAELFWWSEGYGLQPAAEVLLTHPRRNAAAPARAGETHHPLLVQQFVGAGRSMFLGFGETWRWRWREDELSFNQFWIQTVRHLARNRQGRLELRLDRQTPYRRGEPIRVTVRFPDDAPPPAGDLKVPVIVTRTPFQSGRGSDRETMTLAKVEGSRATFEGVLTRTPEGQYQFLLGLTSAPDPKPRAEARVLPPPGEMELLRMNQADMERAADEARGKFYNLSSADRLLDDLPAGTRIAVSTPQPPYNLWNHVAVYALSVCLIGVEWILRKRKHLL